MSRIDLYWIPVGAGGREIVRICARLYEIVAAALQRRKPQALFHTALVITGGSARRVVECAWPAPDDDLSSRGVVAVGPVFTRGLGKLRIFRYEVRCWDDGVIADLGYATRSLRISADDATVERVVAAVASVPNHCWGRDVLSTGEMWNSNSVISYALAIAGVPVADIEMPAGGRAPGWISGIAAAVREGMGPSATLFRQ